MEQGIQARAGWSEDKAEGIKKPRIAGLCKLWECCYFIRYPPFVPTQVYRRSSVIVFDPPAFVSA